MLCHFYSFVVVMMHCACTLFSFIYPTMEDLADMLDLVVDELQIKKFIGFGVGAGAHILCRYALTHPNVVDALILINCSVTQASWLEWMYHRVRK